MGWSWLQPTSSLPVTANAQHRDGKHSIETSNGSHTEVLTALGIAIVRLC